MTPDPAPSVARRGAEILGVAAAYFATGKLALLLAIPPGYATAIWPPAGIALAALLLLGSRPFVGVFLGSFLVNLGTSPSPAIAAVIALGASTQALVGASLIRRYVGEPLELLRWKEIARFLLLGGPASCVVGATVGVATLYATQSIKLSEFQFSWWTWWVGDVIGVAVVAPLVLIAFGEPRDRWRRRAVPVALPLAVLLAIVIGVFIFVSRREAARISSEFQARAAPLGASVQKRLEESVGVLRSLERDRAEIDAATFRKSADGARDRSILALSWNPRVVDADRTEFEKACPIKDRDHKQRLIPAPRRDDYVPIRYIEPHEPNAGALGFDVSSGIARFEALRRAGDSGSPAVTGKLVLVQESSTSGHLVFLPVYSRPSETLEDRRRNLAGYFVAALRLDDFLAPVALKGAESAIDVTLRDAAAEPGMDPFWQSSRDPGGSATPADFQHTIPVEFGGSRWSAVCRATPAYVAAARSWKPWGVLAGGMIATALVGAFLLSRR
jgi:CHASE1-domain containing sensor protein